MGKQMHVLLSNRKNVNKYVCNLSLTLAFARKPNKELHWNVPTFFKKKIAWVMIFATAFNLLTYIRNVSKPIDKLQLKRSNKLQKKIE